MCAREGKDDGNFDLLILVQFLNVRFLNTRFSSVRFGISSTAERPAPGRSVVGSSPAIPSGGLLEMVPNALVTFVKTDLIR